MPFHSHIILQYEKQNLGGAWYGSYFVPAECASSHIISLHKHLEATGHSREVPAVDGSGTHRQLQPGDNTHETLVNRSTYFAACLLKM